MDQDLIEDSRFLLKREHLEEDDAHPVDPETQARLEALLEAAGNWIFQYNFHRLPSLLFASSFEGIGKYSTSDGKALADPEVLRRLTSSVSCALDEAAAALTRMRFDQQGDGAAVSPSAAAAAAILERRVFIKYFSHKCT